MEPNTTRRDEQDSLAPMQLDRRTIDEEVAGTKRGKHAQLLSLSLLASVALVGSAWAMKQMDERRLEREAGAAVAQLRQTHLDAYMQCVLAGVPDGVLDSSERVHSAMEALTERHDKAYARTLAACEGKLSGFEPALASAGVADALEPQRQALASAARAVRTSAVGLRVYLADPALTYDYVAATSLIDRLARATTEYRARDRAFRERLLQR